MSKIYAKLNSDKGLDLQKNMNQEKNSVKASSVKKALNWLFLSEYKE